MKYLPLLLAILLAAPAFGAARWPAGKVIFDDTEDLQFKFDEGDLGGGDFLPLTGRTDLYLQNLHIDGALHIGPPRYFPSGDTTPSVKDADSDQHSLFYSWICVDDFDKHCVDLYDSSSGGPCGDNDAQCSGDPDTLCDHDGAGDVDKAPHREGSADTFCDADATTSFPQAIADPFYITDFDDGTDGQVITVVNIPDGEVFGYACGDPGDPIECGSFDTSQVPSAATWYYDGPADLWINTAYREFPLGPIYSADSDNEWNGLNTFHNFSYGGPPEILTASDTPSVSIATRWETGAERTLTDLTGAEQDGKAVIIEIHHDTTFDCTDAGFRCGDTDIDAVAGDQLGFYYDDDDDLWALWFWTHSGIDMDLANYLPLAGGQMTGTLITAGGMSAQGQTIVTGDLTISNPVDFSPAITFAQDDATPDVDSGSYFETHVDTTAQITDFGAGSHNQFIIVRSGSTGSWSFDCTGSSLDCGTVDLVMETSDTTVWVASTSTTVWYLLARYSGDVDMNLANYALLASPALTGNPTAPTASADDDDTSLATTAYVQGELHEATTDTGPIPDCTGTQLQGADAACIDDLAELNTALGAAGIVTGAHTTDTGPTVDCASTELQDAAGTCVTDLAELNTSLGTGIVTGAHTVSGVIPSGTGPTVDGAGEIAIDTDDNGDASGQAIYWDGTAAAVLTDVQQHCITVESLVDGDDGKPIWANIGYASVTLQSATCVCIGTCTVAGEISFDNAQTGSPGAITGDVACDDPAGSIDLQALSGGDATVTRGEVVLFDNDQTSTTADDDYIICISYKVDRQ